jgi:hypothetical protein
VGEKRKMKASAEPMVSANCDAPLPPRICTAVDVNAPARKPLVGFQVSVLELPDRLRSRNTSSLGSGDSVNVVVGVGRLL